MALLENFWFGCGHCHGGKGCPMAQAADLNGDVPAGAGGSLVLAAVTVFLFPLTLAILTAWAAGRWGPDTALSPLALRQTAGTLAGLALGVCLARPVITRIVRRPRRQRGGTDDRIAA